MKGKIYKILLAGLLTMIMGSARPSAPDTLVIHGTINWGPLMAYPGASGLLYFEGAVNLDEFGLLPAYYSRIPLETDNAKVEYELRDPIYANAEYTDQAIEDINLVRDQVTIVHRIEYDHRKPYLSIYMLPVKREAPGSAWMEKLTSFDLEVCITYNEDAGRTVNTPRTYAAHSVLATGDWYKIAVEESGIYRIGYEELEEMGVVPSDIDPRHIRIYGNGNGMLPEANSINRPDDLAENAIFVAGEEDGKFDQSDYILFYGESPVKWSYSSFYQKYYHASNIYTDQTCYFLTTDLGPGKRITEEPAPTGEPTQIVDNYDDYAYHEIDQVNLIKSGKEWFGEVFKDKTSYDIDFDLPDLDATKPVYLIANFAARSTSTSAFTFMANGLELFSEDIAPISLNSTVYARSLTTNYVQLDIDPGLLRITVEYSKPEVTSTGWLNYITINAVSKLVFRGGQMLFRNSSSVGPGEIVEFRIQGMGQGAMAWDVSDPRQVLTIPVVTDPEGFSSIRVATDSLREFLLYDNTTFLKPVFIEKTPNQDLHSLEPADYIIVTNPMFLDQAVHLADFHRNESELSVIVATPDQIYNEFSSGVQDVTAIRDFVRMLYDRGEGGNEPRYLLLFGDASYDYKNRTQEDNNLVPTFESKESLLWASSFATDEYYGCMDDAEGSNAVGSAEIGVGRFPVQTTQQAEDMVNKVVYYAGTQASTRSDWRNDIFFVADDADNNIHLNQAEQLAQMVDTLAPCYNRDKIYLDAYEQMKTPSGDRYPDVNDAIDKAVRNGTLIINYTGQGGEIGWSDERVLDIPTILAWNNIDQLSAFVTATCEFSRYDDPGLTSAGEHVLLNSQGGGIGLFTTSRLAYSQSNFAMNKRFYEAAFRLDTATGEYPRMGDLIRLAKTPSSQNIKNFVLLGDPALRLAYPAERVGTTGIFLENQAVISDTIGAMARVTITGNIEDLQGNKISTFNGRLYPTVFDKPVSYRTRANDSDSREQNFTIQNKMLYKGINEVRSGEFAFSFIVPKDIVYSYGAGKISYYAYDTVTMIDAQGYNEIIIGGTSDDPVVDMTGPQIDIFLNNLSFLSGDATTPSPKMIVKLYDESGINTIGNGIGHDITMVIDNSFTTQTILNEYFVPDINSYQSGSIWHKIGPFSPGRHTLTIRAWDVFNNSSEKTISFLINTEGQVNIVGVYNYPNPFSEGTYFTFTHNKPGDALNVTINIFDLDGRFIHSLSEKFTTELLKSDPIYWDGRDTGGNLVPSGLYLYQVIVSTGTGFIDSKTQKMLIIR